MPRLANMRRWTDAKGDLLPPEKAFSDYETVCAHPHRTVKRTREEFTVEFLKRFRAAVGALWDPRKAHVVLHSSGGDSRILSRVIIDAKLGDLVFVCMEPEQDHFRPIMSALGSPPNIVVSRVTNNPSAYAANAGRQFLGVPGESLQVWSAGYFDELVAYRGQQRYPTAAEWVDRYYYYRYAQNAEAFPGEVVYPILYTPVMRLVFETDMVFDKPLKRELCRASDPELYRHTRYQDDVKIHGDKAVDKTAEQTL